MMPLRALILSSKEVRQALVKDSREEKRFGGLNKVKNFGLGYAGKVKSS